MTNNYSLTDLVTYFVDVLGYSYEDIEYHSRKELTDILHYDNHWLEFQKYSTI